VGVMAAAEAIRRGTFAWLCGARFEIVARASPEARVASSDTTLSGTAGFRSTADRVPL